MFSIFSIFRNTATIQRQHAKEIRRENLRWNLTMLFYAAIAFGLIYGIHSAVSAPSAMERCQQIYSYDACFQALNR